MLCGAKTVGFQNSDCSTIKWEYFRAFFAWWIIKVKSVSFKTLPKKNCSIAIICSTVYRHNWIQTVNSHFDCYRVFITGELPSFCVVFWFHFLSCKTFNNRQEQIIIDGNILKPKWRENILYLETQLLEVFFSLLESTTGTQFISCRVKIIQIGCGLSWSQNNALSWDIISTLVSPWIID